MVKVALTQRVVMESLKNQVLFESQKNAGSPAAQNRSKHMRCAVQYHLILYADMRSVQKLLKKVELTR